MVEPLEITLQVVEAFDQLGVPYFIGGSLASALYGASHSTLDVDLVADLPIESVMPLVSMLESEFYIDEEMILDAIRYHTSFNIIHLTTMFKVDVFLVKLRRFDQVQLQRRQFRVVADDPERKAYFSSAEDIVLAKLEWYRIGGGVSDRQWRDILGVLKVQAGRLDMDYLRLWATELNVADLLQRAYEETR